jgi:uncharacterized protein (DUF1330 family)
MRFLTGVVCGVAVAGAAWLVVDARGDRHGRVTEGMPSVTWLTSAAADEQEGRCDRPVLMLVNGEVTDGNERLEDSPGMGEYLAALGGSQLYPETSGYRLFMDKPIDVFEGEYPAAGFTVLARFPCHAHARAFWYSGRYQSLIPLRVDSSKVLVTVYEELEPPEYMDGRLDGNRYISIPPVDHLR